MTIPQEAVSHEFRTALQQTVMAEKMSKAQLASAYNEKSSISKARESGKEIPSGAVIPKRCRWARHETHCAHPITIRKPSLLENLCDGGSGGNSTDRHWAVSDTT